MYKIQNNSVRFVITALIIIGVAGIIIFSGLHGFLQTTEKTSLRYAPISNTLSSTLSQTNSSRPLLASGKYAVIATKNGSSSISQGTTPHFLMTSRVFQTENSNKLTVIGRQTDPNIAKEKAEIVSYSDKTVHPLSSTNIDGSRDDDHIENSLPEFSSSFQTGPSTISGLIDQDGSVLPATYNISTNSTDYYPSIGASIDNIAVQAIDDGFMTFDKNTSQFSVYLNGNTSPITIKIDNANHVSKYNGLPVYSYSNGVLAVVVGPDYNQVNEDETPSASDKAGDSSVLLIDTKTKKERGTIDMSMSIVTDLLLSKSAKNIFVQTSQSAGIYDVNRSSLRFSIPLNINQFIWRDDTIFAFTASTDGIFTGSLDNNRTTNILPYDKLRPTQLAFFDGNSLYFTAYGTAATDNDSPDAYRFDMLKQQSATDKIISQKLPYQGNNFYIDAIDHTITIQTTRYLTSNGTITDNAAKTNAEKYIKNSFGDHPGYEVKNTYIDNDLRPDEDED